MVNAKRNKSPKIMALDTSTDCLSVAIMAGGDLIYSEESDTVTRHSESLTLALQKALRSSRLKLSDLDAIAVGLGPGSFTGLRVGVTSAKVMAYSLKIKLIGVSGFEAMAEGAPVSRGSVAMMMDARKSMVYGAIYRKQQGKLKAITRPCLMSLGDFLKRSKDSDCVIGDMALPKARFIAKIAHERFIHGDVADIFKLEPLYVHERDCNVNRS